MTSHGPLVSNHPLQTQNTYPMSEAQLPLGHQPDTSWINQGRAPELRLVSNPDKEVPENRSNCC